VNIAREDITAPRTASQTSRYQPGYDCPLPDDALREFLGRRRPQPAVKALQRPQSAWKRVLCALALLFPIAFIALLTYLGWHSTTRRHPLLEQTFPPMSQSPAPQVGAPAPITIVEVRRAQLVPITVRRAEFVKGPPVVKRASLMKSPAAGLGVYQYYALPESVGGGEVLARFLGTVARFSDIPPDPAPGDMWNVAETGTSWIYCIPLGGNHLQWIDPPL
jgi:hypothetical protein